GLLQPLDAFAQFFEVGILGPRILQRADIGECVVDALVLGLAAEVKIAAILVEAPERRLSDAGVVGDSRERLTAVDTGEGLPAPTSSSIRLLMPPLATLVSRS
ncbi:hypothetical protein, partial [Halorubrum sp. SP9]|uniref:hypothetical protein n=1 Tax=Halorubrum sp. SP9 TaxID=1537267 RepID=UPI0018EE7A46